MPERSDTISLTMGHLYRNEYEAYEELGREDEVSGVKPHTDSMWATISTQPFTTERTAINIDLTKTWDNSSDNDDIESVTFELWVKSDDDTVDSYVQSIEVTEDSNWKGTFSGIAELTADGGYTYYVKETTIKYTDGTETDGSEFNISGTTEITTTTTTSSLGEDGTYDITEAFEVKNTKAKGNLTITLDFEGETISDTEKSQIYFNIKNGDNVIKTVNYSEMTKVTGTDTLTYTVELPVGDYTVEQGGYDVDGYEATVTYKSGSDTTTDKATVTVEDTKESKVEVTDKYVKEEGSLTITLDFTGETISDAEKEEIYFTITNGDDVTVTVKYEDMEVKDGVLSYTATLPVGDYTVTESGYEVSGYGAKVSYTTGGTTTSDSASVEVKANQESKVDVVDDYTKDKGQLTITLDFDGDSISDSEKEQIYFTITNGDDVTMTVKYEDMEVKNGVLSYTTDLPVGEYTITESDYDVDGYEAEVSYTSGSTTTTDKAEIKIEKSTESTVDVVDKYTIDKGELTITLDFTGETISDDEKEEIFFTITNGTDVTETVSYKDMTVVAGTETLTYTLELPVGTYTVTESNYDVDGYGVSVTYKVGTETTTANGEVEVVKNQESKVEVTDNYTKDKGELTITLDFTGETITDAEKEEIYFTVTNGVDVTETVSYKDMTVVAGTDTLTYTLELPVGTYTVTESDYDVDGYGVSVTYKVGTETTTANGEVEVVKNQESKVEVTDNYTKDKGELTITLDFTGETISDDEKEEIYFTITNGTDVTKTVKYEELTLVDGVLSYTTDLPVGTYTVIEGDYDVDGYESSISYTVNDVTNTAKAEVEVKKSEKSTVDVINNYVKEKGELTITLDFEGDAISETEKEEIYFTIKEGENVVKTVNYEDMTKVSGTDTLSYTVELPIGNYTVTQYNYDASGYEVEVSYKVGNTTTTDKSEVEVKSNAESTVEVTDKYTKDTGKVTITLDFDGDSITDEEKEEIYFTITNGDDVTITVKYEDMTLVDGVLTYTEELPVGTYTIIENDYTVDGYEVEVSYKEGSTTTTDKAEINVGKNTESTVDVTNKYTQEMGKLTITLDFTGETISDDEKEEIYFTIKDGDTVVKTVKYEDMQVVNGVLSYTADVPVGNYTVQENAYEVSGYGVRVSYETDGTTTADKAQVEVKKNSESIVDVIDNYTKDKGQLTITLDFAGDSISEDEKEEIYFTIKEGQTVVKTVNYEDMTVVDGNLTYIVELPAGTYTITEGGYDVDGYDVTVSYDNVITQNTEIIIAKDGEYTVDVIDEYTQHKGELTITLDFTGETISDAEKEEIYFIIKQGEAVVKSVNYEDMTVVNGVLSYTLELPTGVYTVTEGGYDVDGYEATITYQADNKTTTDMSEVEVKKNQESKVDVVDNYAKEKGELTITLDFTGDTISDDEKEEIYFTITNGTDVTKTVKYEDMTLVDGVLSYTVELPVGTYTVTEKDYDVSGYEANVNYKVENVTSTVNASVEVKKKAESVVDVINDYIVDKGTLTITLDFEGETISDAEKEEIYFTITNGTDVVRTVNYEDMTLVDGVLTYSEELPIGSYTVIESDYEVSGYGVRVSYETEGVTTTDKAQVEVKKNTESIVDVIDAYTKDKGEITITLDFEGSTISDAEKKEIYFTIKEGDNVIKTVNYEDMTVVDGTLTYTVELPIGTYTVIENDYDVNGYTVDVSYENDGVTTTDKSKVEVKKDEESTVNVTNVYTQDKGELVITLNFEGETISDAEKEEIYFTIKNGDITVKTVTYSDFENVDGELVYKAELPVGNYTVIESDYEVTGYGASVSYVVEYTETGDKAEAEVKKNDTTYVDVTNAYTKDKGTIVITSSFDGEEITESDKENITYTIKDGDTVIKTITYKDFEEVDGKLVYIVELPVGDYTITENGYEVDGYGASVTYKVENVTTTDKVEAEVNKNEITYVDITNSYTKDKGTLVITTSFKGEDITEADKEDIILTIKNGDNVIKTITYKELDKVEGKLIYTVELPVGNYTVIESGYEVAGYGASVTYKAENVTTKDKAEAGVKNNETTYVDIINSYTKDKGTLVITSSFKGDEITESDKEKITYTIKDGDDIIKTITYKDFTEVNGEMIYTVELPVGSYTVFESGYDVDGYETIITYISSISTSSDKADTEIKKDETSYVVIITEYTKSKETDIKNPGDGPNTGDNTPIVGGFMFMIMSFAGMVMMYNQFAKKEYKKEK